ncbi:MAG: hypothetical protein ILP12_00520 [Lachnospiraceae bacterium]|nr:hypothetical protein [Lachnospiraceae bacterium]
MADVREYGMDAVFVLAGILVLVFHEAMMGGIAWMVGGVMLLYAVNGVLRWLARKDPAKRFLELMDMLILVVLAVVVFAVHSDFTRVCVIWAIWSILREGYEVADVLERYRQRAVRIVDYAESAVVVVLSVMLVLSPAEHAHAHVILLGIELILEVVFPLTDRLIFRKQNGQAEKQAEKE